MVSNLAPKSDESGKNGVSSVLGSNMSIWIVNSDIEGRPTEPWALAQHTRSIPFPTPTYKETLMVLGVPWALAV